MYIIEPTYDLLDADILDFPWIIHDKEDNEIDSRTRARAKFYFELIEEYNYPENRIECSVFVPCLTFDRFADLVVYEDADHSKPYLVACLREENLCDDDFFEICCEAVNNSYDLGAKHAIAIAGDSMRIIRIEDGKDLDTMPKWKV